MAPVLARTLVHTTHLVTFLVLFASGLLLLLPNLRAATIGGYALTLQLVHRWGGVAFVVLPASVVLLAGVRTVFWPPAVRTTRAWWQGLHVLFTLVMSAIFTVTGAVIWAAALMPVALHDLAQLVHDRLTYVAAALLGLHLVEVGAASLLARVRAAAGIAESKP